MDRRNPFTLIRISRTDYLNLLLKLYRKLRKIFLSPKWKSNPQPSDLRWGTRWGIYFSNHSAPRTQVAEQRTGSYCTCKIKLFLFWTRKVFPLYIKPTYRALSSLSFVQVFNSGMSFIKSLLLILSSAMV